MTTHCRKFAAKAPGLHPLRKRLARLSLAGFLCASALVALPVAIAQAQAARQSQLENAEAELMQQLEEAQRLEALTKRRETLAREARERDFEEKKRTIAAQNEAARLAKEETLRKQIEDEMSMQGEMFERQKRNKTASSRDLLGAHAASDTDSFRGQSSVRIAPKVPELRDLPRAIFKEKSITIPVGTDGFNNEKKLKLTQLILDADGDGQAEVVRYVDRKSGALIRQADDRNYDGKMDSFVRFERNRPVARELDSNDDGRPDIWERYAEGRLVERKLDRDNDEVVDAFYEYKGGFLAVERHDADNNGEIDLRIEYRNGRREKAEEDSDRDGRPDTWTRYGVVDGVETVTHIELDKTGRGFADTFESFEAHAGKAMLARREEDLDGDGEIDMVSIYRAGKLVRREILKPEVVPL